jgi:hypothetical protein
MEATMPTKLLKMFLFLPLLGVLPTTAQQLDGRS